MTEQKVHAEHKFQKPLIRDLPFTWLTFPQWILLLIIRGYQIIISPVLPADTCRFYPSCSNYGFQAIYKYGAIKGSWLALKRIVRCNPFNPGGFDPVP